MDSDSIIAHAFGWHEEAAHADPIVVGGGGAQREELHSAAGNGQRWLTWTRGSNSSLCLLSV